MGEKVISCVGVCSSTGYETEGVIGTQLISTTIALCDLQICCIKIC